MNLLTVAPSYKVILYLNNLIDWFKTISSFEKPILDGVRYPFVYVVEIKLITGTLCKSGKSYVSVYTYELFAGT